MHHRVGRIRTSRRAGDRQARSGRTHGFTLVELLVVISIIGILVGILLPALNHAIGVAQTTRTHSRIHVIGQGVYQFRQEHGYFPGQGRISDVGNRGSAFLGEVLFVDEDGNFPSEEYVGHEEGMTAADDDHPRYTLLDGMRRPMAICYYPSIPGESGMSQYSQNHNSHYTTSENTGGNFSDFIRDERLNGDQPYKPGEFLLIAPGRDRRYFTDDDITNW